MTKLQTIESLILASASPRRRELLTQSGLTFEVLESQINEDGSEAPRELVERLALEKAQAVAKLRSKCFVIGADTVVAIDQQVLGKPSDQADAKRMLKQLSGRTHEVWGAFALICSARKIRHVESSVTEVTFVTLDPELIDWYVESGEPLDKAGAYGAQGLGAHFIERVNGSYTNVVGLNLSLVLAALREYQIVRIA